MPRRIDIEGGDPQNEIEEALRQLTQRQRPPERDDDLERAVQEVAEHQRAVGVARRPKPPSPWAARIAWIGIAVVVIGLIVAAVLLTRPEPLPDPATNPEEAVRGFWNSIIEGHYEGATVFYPSLVQSYGSRRQAAQHLRELYAGNPPVNLRRVEQDPDQPDPNTYRVTYEVYMRSGLPKVGDCTVVPPATQTTGYVIITGAF
jgi:hypothetical protein